MELTHLPQIAHLQLEQQASTAQLDASTLPIHVSFTRLPCVDGQPLQSAQHPVELLMSCDRQG